MNGWSECQFSYDDRKLFTELSCGCKCCFKCVDEVDICKNRKVKNYQYNGNLAAIGTGHGVKIIKY